MAKYNVIHSAKYGIAVIKYKKNIFSKIQWGVIDAKEEITLFTGEFEDMIVLNHNLIARKVKIAKDKFKWELAKKNGEKICSPKYDECPEYITRIWTSENASDYFYMVPIDRMYTLIDGTGHQLCKPKYTRLRQAYSNERSSGIICEGAREGYWYKINTKGVELKVGYYGRGRYLGTNKRYV